MTLTGCSVSTYAMKVGCLDSVTSDYAYQDAPLKMYRKYSYWGDISTAKKKQTCSKIRPTRE